MRERLSLPASGRRSSFTIDVVVFSPRGRSLAVLCVPAGKKGKERALPYGAPAGEESLERCARRVVKEAVGQEPAWIEQIGAFAEGKRHVVDAELSIGFVAVLPGADEDGDASGVWSSLSDLSALAPRQRTIADAGLAALRARLDHAPIAFKLLPPRFTLSELQQTYEMLLGKRLHKASFRRALQAAYLVEPTDKWRSEGRGRPAQLFAFSPRKRRQGPRGVRFDGVT